MGDVCPQSTNVVEIQLGSTDLIGELRGERLCCPLWSQFINVQLSHRNDCDQKLYFESMHPISFITHHKLIKLFSKEKLIFLLQTDEPYLLVLMVMYKGYMYLRKLFTLLNNVLHTSFYRYKQTWVYLVL